MKARCEYILLLSHKALEILNELYSCTGSSKYIFPSIQSDKLPMFDGTLRLALRPLGFSNEVITYHVLGQCSRLSQTSTALTAM
ncbi:MAG: hypothetical protein IJ576_04085 [Synergistaceae bacterium]|nr:hypothetical protein [Synergistaceae bacterium]MBR1418129.1 hypothetical protein [Synergistaceae bacterium]